MTQTIALNKLVISPRNVRKTNADEDIPGLADSIASKGLLQNLVVSRAQVAGGGSAKEVWEVDAGGRRLRALQLLAERKTLPKNWPVPVFEIARENATEASLAENLQKVAMNPADEVEAFAAIVQGYADNGMSSPAEQVANCARRFGVSERHVKQRLALAALAPEVLDALRSGAITVAAAQAYASHPDQAEQLKVFQSQEKRSANSYGRHEPRFIRDEFKGRFYPADHKLVRYIGLDAYRAAGGRSVVDLFFDDAEREMLLDTALVEKLARDTAEVEAQKLAQAEGWLDAELAPMDGHWSGVVPEGYERIYWGAKEVPESDRGEALALYSVGGDGVLEQGDSYFVKADALDAVTTRERAESAEDRAARQRESAILAKAARLAAPEIAGTPFEGKLKWPASFSSYDLFEDDEDETLWLVQLELRIPRAEVDAQLAEAERRYEFEQEELREEAEALAAEPGPDDEDDDEQDPAVNDQLVQEAAPAPVLA